MSLRHIKPSAAQVARRNGKTVERGVENAPLIHVYETVIRGFRCTVRRFGNPTWVPTPLRAELVRKIPDASEPPASALPPSVQKRRDIARYETLGYMDPDMIS